MNEATRRAGRLAMYNAQILADQAADQVSRGWLLTVHLPHNRGGGICETPLICTDRTRAEEVCREVCLQYGMTFIGWIATREEEFCADAYVLAGEKRTEKPVDIWLYRIDTTTNYRNKFTTGKGA